MQGGSGAETTLRGSGAETTLQVQGGSGAETTLQVQGGSGAETTLQVQGGSGAETTLQYVARYAQLKFKTSLHAVYLHGAGEWGQTCMLAVIEILSVHISETEHAIQLKFTTWLMKIVQSTVETLNKE